MSGDASILSATLLLIICFNECEVQVIKSDLICPYSSQIIVQYQGHSTWCQAARIPNFLLDRFQMTTCQLINHSPRHGITYCRFCLWRTGSNILFRQRFARPIKKYLCTCCRRQTYMVHTYRHL
ncbi:hypothetical protein BO70DRAFT_116123 [Aspergillus heteromorphus CBS 117.55]|uniref:C2H2-type domain-containing protein n=1 Tax=Aspergillus heteromorphus CBS 117.55 TaxID=1448321 RepID=A0A317VGP9_9EURO|nr:uncharacterized protein BO70DRAFT_116123 [Aspergillus heteromorphus CBS 117.55]PWY72317.1 hypothetical protein BO70DRAFT_116123 [Aspergillus heteromorphus CBS 117.55]